MKRIAKKKLRLDAETIQLLSTELQLVVGGAGNTGNAQCVSGSVCHVCRPGDTVTC